MKSIQHRLMLTTIILLITVCACTKPYIITTPLENNLDETPTFFISDMEDHLPSDMKAEDKPTIEELSALRGYLEAELQEQGLIPRMSNGSGNVQYQLNGAVLSFKAGSGFLRFLFGAWAGSAKLTVSLELIETTNENIIFAGNFTRIVTSWVETRDEMYKNIAKDFSKALKKQREDISGTKIMEIKPDRYKNEF